VVHHTSRLVLGAEGRIGSTIYGTLLVLAATLAAYGAERRDPGKLVELVVTVVLVFWITFVYAQALAESIERGTRIGRETIVRVAGGELGIVQAAVLPVAALLLGVVGLISESASIWVAVAVGLATLFVEGYRYSRAVSLGAMGTVSIMVLNLALGVSVVALKVALVH